MLQHQIRLFQKLSENFTLALTIAHPVTLSNSDNIIRLIIWGDYVPPFAWVVTVMEKDSNPFCKRITFPATAMPEMPRVNFQATGWAVRLELKTV